MGGIKLQHSHTHTQKGVIIVHIEIGLIKPSIKGVSQNFAALLVHQNEVIHVKNNQLAKLLIVDVFCCKIRRFDDTEQLQICQVCLH